MSTRVDGKGEGVDEKARQDDGAQSSRPSSSSPSSSSTKITQRTLSMPQVVGGPTPSGAPSPPQERRMLPGEHRRPTAPPLSTPTPMTSGAIVSPDRRVEGVPAVKVARTMNVGAQPAPERPIERAAQKSPSQRPPGPPPPSRRIRPSAPMQWEPPPPAPGSPAASITNALNSETAAKQAESARPPSPSSISGRSITGEVDAAFDRMLDETGGAKFSSAPPGGHDVTAMRELFAQIAANYMRQVRDFVIELQWAEVSRDWLAISLPAVRGLRSAAAAVKIDGLVPALDEFIETLARAQTEKSRTVAGATREAVLASYGRLAQTLPTVFALGEERNRREAIIVHALLSQVAEVGQVTLDKMYRAGLGALDVMLLAKPGDVASATGIDMPLAVRICERFAKYKKELAAAEHDENRTNERDLLAALIVELRLRHDQLEAIGRGAEGDAKKKRALRKERDAKLAEIHVALAQMGAVDLVTALQPMPFADKLAALETYLQESAKTSTGA